ncbi:MAG: hypothetical protein RLZ75_1815 [Pseudomonadota bacterium]|jgi:two-component system chemotaxis sensor kinase CheA
MTDDEILVEFIVEAREILDQLDLDFVQLDEDPHNAKLVGNIFRGMHTLKGSSRFFAFKRLEIVSHASESLLGKIRDGQLILDSQKVTVLLSALDSLREIIEGIEASKIEPVGDDADVVKNLLDLAAGQTIELTLPLVGENITILNDLILDESIADIELSSIALEEPKLELSDQSTSPAQSLELEREKGQEVKAPVKVSLELLDKLMNLVSEMVLARNRLLPFTNEIGDHNFASAVRVIDLLTLELQERMMKTRMQPISQVWTKFPRLIRDVSNECNKKINLTQEGAETELDRTLLDAIRDPLMHIVRNSIDHGIETSEERLLKGKPAIGKLLLRASHENGMVVIEVADDGAGVNYDLVREKVIEKNLMAPEKVSILSDLQLLEFIFLPGFSTKTHVTNLSGRGVGMDVVKTNVSNIGGSIDIDSIRGIGTAIRLKIPLTLAIMPALFIRCGSEPYAIPQNSILEVVRLGLSNASTGLEDFYGIPVFRLRDKLVPLLFLSEQLDVHQEVLVNDQTLNVAILQSSGVRFGLIVDEVMNIQEVVVKPLGPFLKEVKNFAGATILGNGRVSLILDVDGLAVNSGLVAKIQARPLNTSLTKEVFIQEEVPMLLFELNGLDKLAINLEYVERLEMISSKMIQRNGSRDVVRYGDEVMTLIYLNKYIEGANPHTTTRHEGESISVIVHYANKLPVGLVVNKIHDIIHASKKLHESCSPQKGLLGCITLNKIIINVIDINEILIIHDLQQNAKGRSTEIDMDFTMINEDILA